MSRFLDGPAAGVSLDLRRAPRMLRVVIERGGGAVDALDQLEDCPRSREDIHVYRQVPGTLGVVFACSRGSRSAQAASGRYEQADYRHVPDVDGEAVRDRDAWVQWVRRRATQDEWLASASDPLLDQGD